MNVEYRCPECGSRLAAAPGGTTRPCVKDPAHGIYIQVEDYNGPDFFNIDDQGNTRSQGHVQTGGVQRLPVAAYHKPKPSVEESEDLDQARARYIRETGLRPDGRWGVERVRNEIKTYQRTRQEDIKAAVAARVAENESRSRVAPIEVANSPAPVGETVDQAP